MDGGGSGRRGKGLGGGARASVPGVSGRDRGSGTEQISQTCVVFLSFLTRTKRRKMAFFEGCPVRALVAGEGWGGVGAMAVPKKGEGWVPKRSKSREGVSARALVAGG